jgi:hypothetical protein
VKRAFASILAIALMGAVAVAQSPPGADPTLEVISGKVIPVTPPHIRAMQDPAPAPRLSYTVLMDSGFRLQPVVRYEAVRLEGVRFLGSGDVQLWGLSGLTNVADIDQSKFTLGAAAVLPWKLGTSTYFYLGLRGQAVAGDRPNIGLVLGIEVR